jgi:hypothetical protein
MNSGACDIARSYIDKYIIIWNAVAMTVLKSYCYMTLVMSVLQCTVAF